jgi:sulfur carrier protein
VISVATMNAQPAVQIIVNGRPLMLSEGPTVADLIRQLDVGGRYAVEVNQQIVPRSEHAHSILKTGDRVEIVQAIGGG